MMPSPSLVPSPPGANPTVASRHSLATVLVVAALLGASCGIASAVWPVSLENGQALAGLVPFVRQSSWNVYLFRLWSLINQGTGLLLWLGLGGPSVAMVCCAVMGALSLVALALLILAFGGSTLVAAAAPLLIYVCELKGLGFSYPIDLMRTPHVFGIIGFSYVLLTLGFWGNGRDRIAMFLAGLGPAVHPSWGAFGLLTLAGGAVVDGQARRRCFQVLPALGIGLAATGASYLLQRHLGAAAFAMTGPVDMTLYQRFLHAHDVHRLHFVPHALDVFFFLFTVLGLALALWKRVLPAPGATLAKSVLVALAAAGGLTLAAWLLPDVLLLQMLMAPRFFNLAIILAAPLFFGLTSGRACGGAGIFLALLLAAAVLLAGSSDAWRIGLVMAFFLLSLALMVVRLGQGRDNRLARAAAGLNDLLGWLCHPALVGLLALFLFVQNYYSLYRIEARFHDASNDSFFALCSARPGPFLPAAGVLYPQWHIQRPEIFYPEGLDMASYFPDLLPSMRQLAKDVYGEDILVVHSGSRDSGLYASHRVLWEERSANQWQELAKRFGFTDILTPADWTLRLPLVGSNCDYALYAIP